jgi:TPR repeat protein
MEGQANKGDSFSNKLLVERYVEEYELSHKTLELSTKIIYWSKKGLLLKDSDTLDKAFYLHQLGRFTADNKEKYSFYKQAALFGDVQGQWITGLNYLEGQTRPIKNDSAFYWIKKASDNGYECATKALGDIYYEGKIIKPDTLTAIYYYKKACACYGNRSVLAACDSVIVHYKRNKNLRDTSELGIYSELARSLRQRNLTK